MSTPATQSLAEFLASVDLLSTLTPTELENLAQSAQ